MSEVLINTSAAATSKTLHVNETSGIVTLIAKGLSSGEEINVKMRYDDLNFDDIYDSSTGEKITIGSTSNVFVIDVPGYYMLEKPITTSTVVVSAFWSK